MKDSAYSDTEIIPNEFLLSSLRSSSDSDYVKLENDFGSEDDFNNGIGMLCLNRRDHKHSSSENESSDDDLIKGNPFERKT